MAVGASRRCQPRVRGMHTRPNARGDRSRISSAADVDAGANRCGFVSAVEIVGTAREKCIRMRHHHRGLWILLALSCGLFSCAEPPAPKDDDSAADDNADDDDDDPPLVGPDGLGVDDPVAVEAALRAAGVVGVRALPSLDSQTLAFELFFEQPIDHNVVDGRTFLQRAVLVHRHTQGPMVLNPTGYMLFDLIGSAGSTQQQEELTTYFLANQLQVEHRFFGRSFPDDLGADDWQHLTVAQAAADHHAIVTILKKLYADAWIETGHSKGGMTSVYHHVLYPDDVDAVVAYVAPISFAINDRRGRTFLKTLGDPACRDTLRGYQENAASQRSAILDLMQTSSPSLSRPELDAIFASTVGTIEWGYWQYAEGCGLAAAYVGDRDPAVTAAQLGLTATDYDSLPFDLTTSFLPYSYQVANELGQPDQFSAHLDVLLEGADASAFAVYRERELIFPLPTFDDGAAMRDIQERVRAHDDIVFVYGGYDPWTSAAFDPGEAGNLVVTAAGGTHTALLADLEPANRDAAFALIAARTGLDLSLPTMSITSIDEPRWRAARDQARSVSARHIGIRPSSSPHAN